MKPPQGSQAFDAAVLSCTLQVCRAAGVPLIVNDRVDVALAAGPDVVREKDRWGKGRGTRVRRRNVERRALGSSQRMRRADLGSRDGAELQWTSKI
eukprot:1157218-Pelagomonas_calceolata.AAC.23